jgi:hypothetical protein
MGDFFSTKFHLIYDWPSPPFLFALSCLAPSLLAPVLFYPWFFYYSLSLSVFLLRMKIYCPPQCPPGAMHVETFMLSLE